MEFGRRLWVLVLVRVAVARVQGAHGLAVDGPHERSGRPVEGVGVELCLRGGDSGHAAAVVPPGNALAEVIRLHFRLGVAEVVARPLPVNLVVRVGHEYRAADEAGAGGSLHDHVDAPKVDVEVGPDVGGLFALVDGEFGALGAVFDDGVVGEGPAVGEGGLFGEVDRVVLV